MQFKHKLLGLFLIILVFVPIVFGDQFSLDISKGIVPGHTVVHKLGHDSDVEVAYNTLWSNGTLYPWLDTATLMNVSSTDVDDTLFGTGAWNVTIEGLDANYNQINETLILNGQNPVSTVNSYLRIQLMYVHKTGSSNYNEGIINLGTGPTVAGKPLNVYGLIEATYGQTMMAFYTVPAGKTAFITNIQLSAFKPNKVHEIAMRMRLYNESFRRIIEYWSAVGVFQSLFVPDYRFDARTDIEFIARVDVAPGIVFVAFDIILVDNDSFNIAPEEVDVVGLVLDGNFLGLILVALVFTVLSFVARMTDQRITLVTVLFFMTGIMWMSPAGYWMLIGTFVPGISHLFFAIGMVHIIIGIGSAVYTMSPDSEADSVI